MDKYKEHRARTKLAACQLHQKILVEPVCRTQGIEHNFHGRVWWRSGVGFLLQYQED